MNLKHCLGLSIALNVVALGLLAFLSLRPNAARPEPAVRTLQWTDFSNALSVNTSAPPKTAAAPAVSWVDALRHSGVTEELIGEFASASFQSRWEKLSRENQKKFARGEIDEDAMARFDLDHDAEQEKAMRAALGDDAYRRWDQARILADVDRADLQLSASESEELYNLRKAMDRKRTELDRARLDGSVNQDEAGGQANSMYSEFDQQVRKLLGDQRYMQLQNGGDTGLGDLRRTLRTMSADDSQMAGMESAQQAWTSERIRLELQMQKGELSPEDYDKQLKAATEQRDREYATVLGTDGFTEFQKSQDDRYRRMKKLGPSLGFSDSDVNSLYAAIQTYENDVRDYRERAQAVETQGQPVDWPEVEKTLKDFSQQTEKYLRDRLGDKFDEVKRRNLVPFER